MIQQHHLRFPLELSGIYPDEGEAPEPPEPANWFRRWIARCAAARILNGKALTYQFGGYTGALKKNYELVDAGKEQLAHWVLRDVGYSCCPGDIQEVLKSHGLEIEEEVDCEGLKT